jgi:hypothetical protein
MFNLIHVLLLVANLMKVILSGFNMSLLALNYCQQRHHEWDFDSSQ